jgi:hypothetical protein
MKFDWRQLLSDNQNHLINAGDSEQQNLETGLLPTDSNSQSNGSSIHSGYGK